MGTKTFHRGVIDAKIAPWTAENTFGTVYDIKGIRNTTTNLVLDTDELGGDDAILDSFAVIEAATLAWEMAAVDLDVLRIMLGGSIASNSDYEDLVIGKPSASSLPYFAFAFAVNSSTGEVLHVFFPKCKLDGNIQLQAQYKQYLLPGASLKVVQEGETNGVGRIRKFSGPTALSIPLATEVD